jgi:hypothetical protein
MARHAVDLPDAGTSDLAALHCGARSLREVSRFGVGDEHRDVYPHFRRFCFIWRIRARGLASHTSAAIACSFLQSCGVVRSWACALYLVRPLGARGVSLIANAPPEKLETKDGEMLRVKIPVSQIVTVRRTGLGTTNQQRTRPSLSGYNPRIPTAGSLNLGR